MNRKNFIKKGGIVSLWAVGLGSLVPLYKEFDRRQFNNQVLAINRQGYEQRYNTIAHELLALEDELGAGPADRYFLDKILDKILEKTANQKVTDKKTALRFLKTIDDAIEDEGFKKYKRASGCGLHKGLTKERKLDCYGTSLIYKAVTELTENFDLDIVVLPRTREFTGHVCLKLDDFYWDTIESKERTSKFYRNQRNISKRAINEGIYLKGLDKNGILSMGHEKVGVEWFDRRNYQMALNHFKKAIEIEKKNVSAYFNIGYLYYLDGNFKKAKKWHSRAKKLDLHTPSF